MIIRRTPQPENIIALEIEKYEQSIALMRDEVIESHRLDSLKPMRLTTWEILEPSERKMPRSSKRAPEVGKGYVPSSPIINKQTLNQSCQNRSSAPRCQVSTGPRRDIVGAQSKIKPPHQNSIKNFDPPT